MATLPGVDYRVADLDDLAAVLWDFDVDICMHCAGPFVE